jgi:GNAT superfamily N-acetyltransferase
MKIRTGTIQEAVDLARRIPDFTNPYNLDDPGTPMPKLDHVLIAEEDGVPVGFRAGYRHSPDTFAVWLAGVLPGYRRRGIAGVLYRTQKNWLVSRGYRFIRTHVRNANRVMIKILVDNGYHVVDVVRYADVGRNKVVFVKNLREEDDRMNAGSLIVGLLKPAGPGQGRGLDGWLRDITISWLRFKYPGRIIEGPSVDEILRRACASSQKYCFILTHGTIISHAWELGFVGTLEAWANDREFLAAGEVPGEGDPCRGLLVDLESYERLARPRDLVAASLAAGIPVQPLPDSIAATLLNIAPEDDRQAESLKDLLGDAIAVKTLDPSAMGAGQFKFLTGVQRQVQNSRRGIFVWNFESYDDVNEPPADFAPPVSTLYSVAAGLKTNWILQTHGFDEKTRLVYFDYSEQALQFKKLLHEEWDGEDYPDFLRHLFRTLRPGEAFYQLWGGFSPEDMAWDTVGEAWTREIARWGGEAVIKENWRRARDLRVEYVLCNILEDQTPLLDRMDDRPNSVIWWSNVFFTFYSNWFHRIEERRAIYEGFIRRLTRPDVLIYGNDYNNIPINAVRAAEYANVYFQAEDDYLEPRKIRG